MGELFGQHVEDFLRYEFFRQERVRTDSPKSRLDFPMVWHDMPITTVFGSSARIRRVASTSMRAIPTSISTPRQGRRVCAS